MSPVLCEVSLKHLALFLERGIAASMNTLPCQSYVIKISISLHTTWGDKARACSQEAQHRGKRMAGKYQTLTPSLAISLSHQGGCCSRHKRAMDHSLPVVCVTEGAPAAACGLKASNKSHLSNKRLPLCTHPDQMLQEHREALPLCVTLHYQVRWSQFLTVVSF